MELKFRHILLTVVFSLIGLLAYPQMTNHPPEPRMQDGGGTGWEGCADDDPGNTGNNTPPPGLCMPIDDYIMPLMMLGLLFGAYKVHKMQASRA